MSEELKMKSKSVLKDKSFAFSIHIVELELLHRIYYISTGRFEELSKYINELISMLVSSIKTSKLKLNK